MFSKNNRQYVFRQSSNKISSFFCDDKRGLCCATLSYNNGWNESFVIQKEVYKSFFAEMDEDDTIHLLYQDKRGNVYYLPIRDVSGIKENAISAIPVLNSKIPTVYNKHLSLIPDTPNLNALYVLNHKGSFILAQQMINEGNISTPRVIDYVDDSNQPYSFSKDRAGNLYVFYQMSDDKYFQIGYKKYNASQKIWSDFSPLTRHVGSCGVSSVITDSKDIMHICYQRQSERRYDLVYQQKIQNKNIWTPEIMIHNSMYPFNNSAMIVQNQVIIIYWVRDETIYYSSSNDNGTTWSRPIRYNFLLNKELFCISYRSNLSSEKGKVFAPFIPGNLQNGIKLAFYKDIKVNLNSNTSDENRIKTNEESKILHESIKELNEINTLTNENILRTAQNQEKLEKELIKHSVKIGMLESDLNQIKTQNIRNNEMTSELSEYDSLLDSVNTRIESLTGDIKSLTQDIELKINKVSQEIEDFKKNYNKNKIKNRNFHKLESEFEEIKAILNLKIKDNE